MVLKRAVTALITTFVILLALSLVMRLFDPEETRIARLAQEGDIDAQVRLGDRLDSQRAHAQAVSWYLRAAEQGSATAQRRLGLHYQDGRGVPRDSEKASYWFSKAAGQGCAQSQYWYGRFWEDSGDYRQAANWYLKAAEQGHALSQHHLGTLYFERNRLVLNAVEAYAWLNLAAMDPTVDFAKEPRDRLEKLLKPEDLKRAQQLSSKLHKEIEQRKAGKAK